MSNFTIKFGEIGSIQQNNKQLKVEITFKDTKDKNINKFHTSYYLEVEEIDERNRKAIEACQINFDKDVCKSVLKKPWTYLWMHEKYIGPKHTNQSNNVDPNIGLHWHSHEHDEDLEGLPDEQVKYYGQGNSLFDHKELHKTNSQYGDPGEGPFLLHDHDRHEDGLHASEKHSLKKHNGKNIHKKNPLHTPKETRNANFKSTDGGYRYPSPIIKMFDIKNSITLDETKLILDFNKRYKFKIIPSSSTTAIAEQIYMTNPYIEIGTSSEVKAEGPPQTPDVEVGVVKSVAEEMMPRSEHLRIFEQYSKEFKKLQTKINKLKEIIESSLPVIAKLKASYEEGAVLRKTGVNFNSIFNRLKYKTQ